MRRVFLFSLVFALMAMVYAGWWVFGRSMNQEILSAQSKFIAAIEDRDWTEAQSMLTDDYMDEAGHDRNTVIDDAKRIFDGFLTLTIKTEVIDLRSAVNQATLKANVKLKGYGGGLSQLVVTQANSMQGPWLFHWHKKGRWPWDWKIVQIHHNAVYGALEELEKTQASPATGAP